jgi:hypothetical protein
MKRLLLTAALCLTAPLALAGDTAKEAHSCGERLSENAKYPEQLSATVSRAADLYVAHAQWIGTANAQAKAEHDKLMQLAQEHRALAETARRISSSLLAARDLPAAEHEGPPPAALTQAMQRLHEEMRTFAQLLERGALEGERELQAMRRPVPIRGAEEEGIGGSEAPEDPR